MDGARFQHGLLFKEQGRSADPLRLEVNRDLHAVGNSDERNAAVHAELLAVERHCPFNLSRALALTVIREGQCLRLRYAAYGKCSWDIKCMGTGLYNLCGTKRYVRIFLHVEEIFAPQLVILEATSGVHAGRLDLDIENACRNIRRSKRQRGIPLVKSPLEGNRRFHKESDLAHHGRNFINGSPLRRLSWRDEGKQ